MKKLITILFALSFLNSCANITENSTTVKEKIKSGMIDFKNSINNPLKRKCQTWKEKRVLMKRLKH